MFLEKLFVFAFNDFNFKVSSFGLYNSLGCNKHFLIDEELVSFSFMKIVCHVKSFGT
jgi:hypothetical protein